MIEVAVEKRLGAFQLDASFSAPAAGIIALYGRSGAGKTSLVNAIAGLIAPDRGRIAVEGETLYSSADRINLRPRRRRVGYVFQEGRLFPHFSVRSNLNYGTRNGAGEIKFDAVVALLGIEPLLNRRPADLSGGEKQRVAIGRALLSQPRLLLMDEPLASLDESLKAEIMPFIERLHAELKIPIVYVSHDMDENMRLADTLVLMDAGRVAAVGPVEELTSRLDLQPLTGRYDAGAVIRATVGGHDLNFGLSELVFPGGRLRVSRLALPLGTPVRARIRANDVALAIAKPEQISIRNILPARVMEIAPDRENANVVDVRLRLGTQEAGAILWSRITLRASRELDLAIDKPVFALIKAVALDRNNYVAAAQGEANKSL
ncbi:MAG TPA: molybdenum ABC transporter ATP-binding protein [Stellaceae bacterium]|jgi:molybdate transport system ATP-binding protein|nr:molybdenum ABC transporter ATP-binding protein [Stellaceae bacterium]